MNVAILGATSQIAKNLILFFRKDQRYELFLFARNKKAVYEFIGSNYEKSIPLVFGFEDFLLGNYDAIINCVGITNTRKQREAGVELFLLTEHFDNLVINYLLKNQNAIYINFSSGAVYGTSFENAVIKESNAIIAVNDIYASDFYRIAKLNAEVKHRAMAERNIIDLRVFGFFSHLIDLDSSYLLCEMVRCLKNHKVFFTNTANIVRDYVSPKDLYTLVELCILKGAMNCAFDVYSADPVTKMELIKYFSKEYLLKIVIDDGDYNSLTGQKDKYYSSNKDAFYKLGYIPTYTSMNNVKRELSILLNGYCNQLF